jgi:hypothetical protein
MTVSEYVTRFTQLSRYAPNDVDTDEKKQECFLNELDDVLAYALEVRDFENFQIMVDKALVLENRRYSTLLFLPAVQICCSKAEGEFELFDEEF